VRRGVYVVWRAGDAMTSRPENNGTIRIEFGVGNMHPGPYGCYGNQLEMLKNQLPRLCRHRRPAEVDYIYAYQHSAHIEGETSSYPTYPISRIFFAAPCRGLVQGLARDPATLLITHQNLSPVPDCRLASLLRSRRLEREILGRNQPLAQKCDRLTDSLERCSRCS
jgi:hypothetical protein